MLSCTCDVPTRVKFLEMETRNMVARSWGERKDQAVNVEKTGNIEDQTRRTESNQS